MHVVATAGHVDHGKSTLVRALTGMEPDRWAEERRRGMTIDLGYAWTTLPSGQTLAFVDVPGHQRFIGNMLAGLGPAPAVLVVVAADEGWRRQSGEHLAAVDALGMATGLLAVTRSDLADAGTVAAVVADARQRIADSSLGDVEAVTVSGATGAGIDELRAALARLVGKLPTPDTAGRVRLWVDRAFTVRGSGTVVTGTLGSGTLAVGDELELSGGRAVGVRALQSLGRPVEQAPAVARVAVNLRGVPREAVGRGDALLTPGAWHGTDALDVRVEATQDAELPSELVLHVGSAAVPIRLRPLGDPRDGAARLVLHRALPLVAGDRGILRDPGRQTVAAGVVVLDTDPPPLVRRGAARQRAAALIAGRPSPADVLARRGAVRLADAGELGLGRQDGVSAAGWLVDREWWTAWTARLAQAVDAHAATTPMQPGLPTEAARRALDLPDAALLADLARAAGVEQAQGRLQRPGARASLGAAEPAVQQLEQRLRDSPFAAPERPDLDGAGLGPREVAVAVRTGRLVRIGEDVLLLPDAPARAMRVLADLPQPFTTSEARAALGTTRRVAVPLLEHLDARGWTERLDAGHRRVSPADRPPASGS